MRSTTGKKNEQVKTKGGYLDKAYLSPADVTAIADLPPREVILAMLLGLIQAPARNLVSVINQGVAQIVNVTNAYKEKLETAQKMKQDKMPIDLIMKYTGLTREEIDAIPVPPQN